MNLSITNWNILYEIERPTEKSRFIDKSKTPSLIEKKALSNALGFFCYTDNTSPSHSDDQISPQDRQEANQAIKGKNYRYFRGGSNASVRLGQVVENIKELAKRSDIVCLQEITHTMSTNLEDIFKATHHCLFSFQPGNNHGVMMLINKEGLKLQKTFEISISNQQGTTSRLVRVAEVLDLRTQTVVRVAVAHLFGFHPKPQAADKEASDLFQRLDDSSSHFDAIVLCADMNETKIKRSQVNEPAVCYAQTTGVGGWQLNFGSEPEYGIIPLESKPEGLGVCSIMLKDEIFSKPLNLSDLTPGLSDHPPIGTNLQIEKKAPIKKAPSFLQKCINQGARFWDFIKAGLTLIWQGFFRIFR